ncbi:MAG TPA: hypothetical protein VGF31_01170, partial [Myxococcaceae bacterium]
VVFILGATPVPSTSGPAGLAGKYDLAGMAHVSISPFPAQDYPGEMAATLSRGPTSGALSLRLEARGYGCTLEVRADQDGSLEFPEGATCPLDIAQPDARGHVDAQLRMGRGRIVHGRLEMDLRFDVDGRIKMKVPSRTIRVFGKDIQTPETWAPTAPVHGTVAASGQGQRSPEPVAR